MTEKLNEWNVDPDPETLAYHLRQVEPYRSTVHFAKFARPWLATSNRIIDLGCGAGQATDYIAMKHPQAQVLGLDVSPLLISLAKQLPPQASFGIGDMTNLSPRKADGVISLATLSWMPEYETPLAQICEKIAPKWMAFSTLLYWGNISAQIVINEPSRPRRSYHNIYSVNEMAKFMQGHGYDYAAGKIFQIDIDLPYPANANIMQSYTVGINEMRHIFSGPLHMPWGFVCFEKMK